MSLEGHLALAGHMGSGKSTIGPLVARLMNRPFLDLDEVVTARAGMSIPALFEAGEAAFRVIETDCLRDLAERGPLVLALGGGTMHQPQNHELLVGFTVVWLGVPDDVLRSRLGGDTTRPLLRHLAMLLEGRSRHDLPGVLSVDALGPPGDVAQRIVKVVG